MTPEQVLQAAMDELVVLEDCIAQVAAQLGGTPREVLDRLALDAPTNDTVVAVAKDALAETSAFVAEHDLITMYDDPVEVIVMPEIHRGVAVAYCDPPGPLDPPGTTTFCAISPTPVDWPPERVASFYREVNVHNLRNLVDHEVAQVVHVDLAIKRRNSLGRPIDRRRRNRAEGRRSRRIEWPGWVAIGNRHPTMDLGHDDDLHRIVVHSCLLYTS